MQAVQQPCRHKVVQEVIAGKAFITELMLLLYLTLDSQKQQKPR